MPTDRPRVVGAFVTDGDWRSRSRACMCCGSKLKRSKLRATLELREERQQKLSDARKFSVCVCVCVCVCKVCFFSATQAPISLPPPTHPQLPEANDGLQCAPADVANQRSAGAINASPQARHALCLQCLQHPMHALERSTLAIATASTIVQQ